VYGNPRRSISRRSQELGLSATSTWRILRRDLDLHYKIQQTQELKVNDHIQRHMFADWVLEQLEVNLNFAKQIIFSDEVHFWMNGYVNKQNCRIWNDTNPRKIHQLQMHPEKVTVWYGFDSMNILHERFEGMVISRGGNVNWSPRSCDLTPLDFFLWGYLKSQVYTNKPQTIDCSQSQYNKRHPANSARFMRENHRKLDRPNTCHQARRTFERRYIPYLMP